MPGSPLRIHWRENPGEEEIEGGDSDIYKLCHRDNAFTMLSVNSRRRADSVIVA